MVLLHPCSVCACIDMHTYVHVCYVYVCMHALCIYIHVCIPKWYIYIYVIIHMHVYI